MLGKALLYLLIPVFLFMAFTTVQVMVSGDVTKTPTVEQVAD